MRCVGACQLFLCLFASNANGQPGPSAEPSKTPALKLVGKLDYRPLVEVSGIVASRKHDGVFWVHNDGGSAPALYAVTREGKLLAEFPVGVTNTDWEDIALDAANRIYIADTGNNNRNRRQVTIYRLDEPDPKDQSPAGVGLKRLPATRQWTLEFPDRPFDCEALFIHNGYGYLISKLFLAGKAGVYRWELTEQGDEPIVLEKFCTIPIYSPVTAADLSPDGKQLAVLTVTGLNVFTIDADVKQAAKATPSYIRHIQANAEAVCFSGKKVMVATEAREIYESDAPGE